MALSGAAGAASRGGFGGGGLVGAIVGGCVGGLIGAAIWAALAYFAHLESGWVAWGVGGLAGFGVAVGSGGVGGSLYGILAVLIALGSICLGKFSAVRFSLADVEGTVMKQFEDDLRKNHNNDDSFLLSVADAIAEEWVAAGKTPKWPNSKAAEDREEPSDYPADLLKEAKARWAGLDAGEREALKQSIEARYRANLEGAVTAMRGEISSEGFFASWGAFDLLFVVLAIATSFRIGAGGGTES
jgi:hypothetical protein